MPDGKTTLARVAFAGACVAMGVGGFIISGGSFGLVGALELAGGVANELIPGILDEQVVELTKRLARSNKSEDALNHDIQKALLSSLKESIASLRYKWTDKQVQEATLNILLANMDKGTEEEKQKVQQYQERLRYIIDKDFNQDLDKAMIDEQKDILDKLDEISENVLRKPLSKVRRDLEREIRRKQDTYLHKKDNKPTIQSEAYTIKQSLVLFDELATDDLDKFSESQEFAEMIEKPENFIPENAGDGLQAKDKQKHNFNILNILRNPNQIGEILIPTIFYSHLDRDQNLKKFVQQRLPGEWMFFFSERLKDPGDDGTRAWRALDKIYQQAIMDSLEQIRKDTGQIKGDTRQIKDDTKKMQEQITEIRDVLSVLSLQGLNIPNQHPESGIALSPEQRQRIEENLFRSNELQKVTSEIDNTLEELQKVDANIKETALLLGKAQVRLQKTANRINVATGKLDVTVNRLEKIASQIVSALENLPRILQETYLWILFITTSLIILIGLVSFKIYPDDYSRGLFWTTYGVWIIFIVLATLPLKRFHPWNQTNIRIPQIVWYTFLIPYLAILIGFPAYTWERVNEFFLPKMESQVNVIVSNFDGPEGKGIGTFIEQELQIRLKHLDDKVEIRYPHQRLFNANDVREIANRWDANIVISGYNVSEGDYQADFFMRDPVEGGIEITDGFVIDPIRDLEPGTSERGNMITMFTIGLVNLFSDELQPDYPVRLEEALDSFQTTIDLVEEKDKEPRNKISDLIKSRVYFFQGRTEAQAIETNAIQSPNFTKSITWTDAISSYNKALDLNPNDSWSYIGKGIVYYNQSLEQDPSDHGLMDAAYSEFDEALKLEENSKKNTPDPSAYIQGKAWTNIGNVWHTLADEERENAQAFAGHYDKGIHAFESALREYDLAEKRDRDYTAVDGRYYAHAYYGLGHLHLLKARQEQDQELYKEALEDYTTCLELAAEDDPRATHIRQLCTEGQQTVESEMP